MFDLHVPEIPTWVEFWGLPLEYQTPAFSEEIASRLGTSIKGDWNTEMLGNIRFTKAKILC